MLELHGWLTISETYKDEDKYTNETLEDIMRQVKRIIENSGTQLTLQYMNGMPFLSTLLYANHRTNETDNIIETYKSIATSFSYSFSRRANVFIKQTMFFHLVYRLLKMIFMVYIYFIMRRNNCGQ